MQLILSWLAGSSSGSSSGAGSSGSDVSPSASQLPGYPVIHNLADGIAGWALLACVLGIIIGGVMWAFGHYSQNYHQAVNGRKGVLVSAVAALLVGGASQIINFFVQRGGGI